MKALNLLFRVVVLLLLLGTLSSPLYAAPALQSIVSVTAQASTSPLAINLNFPKGQAFPSSVTITGYRVYRMADNGTSWGNPIATPLATDQTYSDAGIEQGKIYEYKVVRDMTSGGGSFSAEGFVAATVDAFLPHSKGKIITLVDERIAEDIKTELRNFELGLANDGWTVLRHIVETSPTLEPLNAQFGIDGHDDYGSDYDFTEHATYAGSNKAAVLRTRAIIRSIYEADPNNVKGVILIGHVPVPYSGERAVDGHNGTDPYPNHSGAWTADWFYADVKSPLGNGGWSDEAVTLYRVVPSGTQGPVRWHNQNLPSDGKFDQNAPPSRLDLILGRIDFWHMPWLAQTNLGEGDYNLPNPNVDLKAVEVRLLKQYLNKATNYRNGALSLANREFIVEAVYAPFPIRHSDSVSLFGPGNTVEGSWIYAVTNENGVQISIFDTGGHYSDIYGAGRAGNGEVGAPSFYDLDPKVFFSVFSASYMADWDQWRNPLRGVLAAPTYTITAQANVLTTPVLHSLGVSKTIGDCFNIAQNQSQLFGILVPAKASLLGDPTATLYPPKAVKNARLIRWVTGQVFIEWDAPAASSDQLLGYHVYHSASSNGPFQLFVSTLVPPTATSRFLGFTITNANYLVRPLYLRTTAGSGRFSILGTGSATNNSTYSSAVAPVILNQPRGRKVTVGETVALTVSTFSGTAMSYQWYRGGSAISGATSPEYVINSFQSADAGNYHVVVANGSGTVTSGTVNLELHTLAGSATAISIPEEGSAISTISADASLELRTNIVWTMGSAILNVTDKTVTFTADPGQYGDENVTVYLSDGQVSKAITIPVHIEEQPSRHGIPGFSPLNPSIPMSELGDSRVLSGNVWELKGGGNALYPEHSEMTPVTGDFEVSVKLKAFDGDPSVFSAAGVLIRETGVSTPSWLKLEARPLGQSWQLVYWDKQLNGDELSSITGLPVWLKIRRVGSAVTFYYSLNGVDWTGGSTLSLAGTQVEVGLFMIGRNQGGRYQARGLFSNFVLLPGVSIEAAAPTLSGGNFQFNYVAGPVGANAVIESSDDFTSWTTVQTAAITGGTQTYTDSTAGTRTKRFYRAKTSSGIHGNIAVGFYTVDVPGRVNGQGGFALVANQMDNPWNNTVQTLFAGVPSQTLVRKINPDATFLDNVFNGTSWAYPNMTVNPGEGVLVRSPGSASISLKFIGSIREGVLKNSATNGYSFRASVVPQASDIISIQYPGADSDKFYTWNESTQQWDQAITFFEGFGWYDGNFQPNTGSFPIGKGFRLQSISPGLKTWERTFSVW